MSDSRKTPTSDRTNWVQVVLDCVSGLSIVIGLTWVEAALVAESAPAAVSTLLAVWTAIISLTALPALCVLCLSPPRVPLKERSALVASASWFGRTVWAVTVFGLSIVIGATAGVVASKLTVDESTSRVDLGPTLEALASAFVWPIVALVAGVAYVVMCFRWLFDLGVIAADEDGATVRRLFESRWMSRSAATTKSIGLVNFLVAPLVTVASRGALFLTLLTVGLTCAGVLSNWAAGAPTASGF